MCPLNGYWLRATTRHKMQSKTLINDLLIVLGSWHGYSATIPLTHLVPCPQACFIWQFEKLGFHSMKPNLIFALGGQIHDTLSWYPMDGFITSTNPIHIF